jgi:hypothetical protein
MAPPQRRRCSTLQLGSDLRLVRET